MLRRPIDLEAAVTAMGRSLALVGAAVDIQTICSGLNLANDGIWYGRGNAAVSYPADGHEQCFAVEDSSFWFRHRNACIVAVASEFPPPGDGAIFDIGGGNGFVSMGLANAGFDVALVEPGHVGAVNAKRRGVRNVICATAESAQFTPHSLSAAGLFDVIEHIDDAPAFLRSVKGLLRPQGYLYATVPAYQSLWSDEDVSAGHYRRYTMSSLQATLDAAGFDLLFASYIFRFLPVPIFMLRALPHRLGISRGQRMPDAASRDHRVKQGLASRLLQGMLDREVELLKRRQSMRFGGSCLVVAKCR